MLTLFSKRYGNRGVPMCINAAVPIPVNAPVPIPLNTVVPTYGNNGILILLNKRFKEYLDFRPGSLRHPLSTISETGKYGVP